MSKYYLVSVREGGPEFEVLRFDPSTKVGTLRSVHGGVFDESMSAENLASLGYRLEKRDEAQEQGS